MNRDPVTGIAVLDATVDYSDDAEDRILEILENTPDRSSTSDELAESINDWPSRYHFSRLRSGLIEPLKIRPGMRILDVGCGSGAITRRLGEEGAQVVGLEGSIHRARAAHVRCGDLDSVEIVCGALDAYEDQHGFDLVLIVGVLEYAAVYSDDPNPFRSFLQKARSFCRPNGAVALAIENQMGLKYLLSWPEDHLGRHELAQRLRHLNDIHVRAVHHMSSYKRDCSSISSIMLVLCLCKDTRRDFTRTLNMFAMSAGTG